MCGTCTASTFRFNWPLTGWLPGLLFWPWRWRQYLPPKQWSASTRLHYISPGRQLFVVTTVRTSPHRNFGIVQILHYYARPGFSASNLAAVECLLGVIKLHSTPGFGRKVKPGMPCCCSSATLVTWHNLPSCCRNETFVTNTQTSWG